MWDIAAAQFSLNKCLFSVLNCFEHNQAAKRNKIERERGKRQRERERVRERER